MGQIKKREVAVFDFDGTLIKGDSMFGFTHHAIGTWQTLKGMILTIPDIILWKIGKKSNSEAKRRLTSRWFAGKSLKSLKAAAATYEPAWRKEVLEQLEEAKSGGAEVYIISASPDIWMEEMATRLGVKLCCTEVSTDSAGLLTGEFATPNCHGEEKARRLLDVEPDRDNYNLTVWGDDPAGGDAALFAMADKSIKV